jgi:hypothetical protein
MNFTKFLSYAERCSQPEFCFGRMVEFPTVVTHKSPTTLSHFMNHQKAERVTYHNGIQDFWILGQCETQKLSSVQLLLCPEQNSSAKSIFEFPY